MKYYRVSGGIERIWIGDKDTGKVTLDAKALASKGLTYADAMALRNEAKEIDLVSPVSQDNMMIRYGIVEKKRDVMGVDAGLLADQLLQGRARTLHHRHRPADRRARGRPRHDARRGVLRQRQSRSARP